MSALVENIYFSFPGRLEKSRLKKYEQHSYNNCISWQKLYSVKEFKIKNLLKRFQQYIMLPAVYSGPPRGGEGGANGVIFPGPPVKICPGPQNLQNGGPERCG